MATPQPKKVDVEETKKDEQHSKEKSYINLYFCKINVGMVFTYIYLFASILLNIVNRLLYQKFHFKFNFTLMFCQQLFCFMFFTFVASKNENFKKKAGEISLKDFLKLKYYYIFFCLLFTLNYLSSFIGNQLVVNTAMFLILRKFLTVLNYLFDLFVNKKTLPSYFTSSIILITLGTLLTGFDDLTADYLGYFIVFVNNTLSLLYGQMSDKFTKKTGVSNIKLLIYNSYLVTPLLLVAMVVTGELGRLMLFINDNNVDFKFGLTLLGSCLLCVILNSSYLISNEKNSSLFTQLLSNCKDIFIALISLVILKDFKPTFKTIAGIILSTLGALVFSFKSIKDNIRIGLKKKEQ